ncbi:MAG: TonB-dependent receptor [Bacteroidia bacterium 44-10]|nr:MAG: TonB-dependent receptor [Bacteroidia bacterium 44-10]
MKQKLWLWIFLLCSFPAFAQKADVRGRVVDDLSESPIAGVLVILRGNNQTAYTDDNGRFLFRGVNEGEDVLVFNAADINPAEEPVIIPVSGTFDTGDIRITRKPTDNLSFTATIDEIQRAMEDDDAGGLSQDVSAMVIFSNDIFLKNVGYQFSQFRYRIRGYQSRFEERYINGVNFNDQVRGVFNYASVGALNDMTRNGDAVNYFAPSAYSFGSIGGSENINMRAGNYARGGKATISLTNRNYYVRAMASYSTGMQDNGWAVSASIGGRYSDEGNIDGVFYRTISYAFGLEKELNNHRISFMTFGSPVERGQQSASVQEAYDLVDDNLYNPNWGYQNGKKRNARVVKSYDPTGILSHIWRIGEYTTLTSGVGVHYSRYGSTALNWYNGPDPRPDYYRYLPSYHSENQTAFDYYTYLWKQSGKDNISQVNWDRMWEANYINNTEGDGSAIYMVEERRRDLFEAALNSTLNTQFSERVKLTAGIGLKNSLSKQFKTVDDLLGAQYLLDTDKFAERDFPGDEQTVQNDLERSGRRVYEGDVFGYDFRFRVNSADIWFQQEHSYRYIDFYFGSKLKYSEFQREGKMRNGRYPDSSFGKGKKHRFTDYALKGGLTYKISGRHFITGNISYQTAAPLVDNVYISPRITDQTPENIQSMRIFSSDINYVFSLPDLAGRISLFNTNFYDDMMRYSYYHDSERTYVNHLLSGVNKIHRGIELGVNYKLNDAWNFDFIGSIAEYYYSNNPEGVISYENGKESGMAETVYMTDYYLGGTPQAMGTIGINFFYDYWFLNLNINGFARNYVEISPLRRLASNYTGVVPPEANGFDEQLYNAYRTLTDQERFGSGYTLDFSIGKIWYLPNRNSVNFNLTVNNLLNREDIRTGGYEQARINLDYPERFASKYYYMQGINFFFNMSYRF